MAGADRSYRAEAAGSGSLFILYNVGRYKSGSWQVVSVFTLRADEVSLALDGQHAKVSTHAVKYACLSAPTRYLHGSCPNDVEA
jgi:hypothetical protein